MVVASWLWDTFTTCSVLDLGLVVDDGCGFMVVGCIHDRLGYLVVDDGWDRECRDGRLRGIFRVH